MILLNHEDLIGGLVMSTSQSFLFFLHQYKLKKFEQIELVDSRKNVNR